MMAPTWRIIESHVLPALAALASPLEVEAVRVGGGVEQLTLAGGGGGAT